MDVREAVADLTDDEYEHPDDDEADGRGLVVQVVVDGPPDTEAEYDADAERHDHLPIEHGFAGHVYA